MRQAVFARALARAGTGRALAALLNRTEQQISNWKRGRDPIPDEAIAEMAVYVGEDPIEALAIERGEKWKRVTNALKERISAGFDALRLYAKPRQLRLA